MMRTQLNAIFLAFVLSGVTFAAIDGVAKSAATNGSHGDEYGGVEPYVDLPKGCYGKQQYPCTLTVERGFLTLARSEANIHLSKNGVLAFFSADNLQLLKGHMWLKDAKKLTVKLSSVLQVKVDGDWLVRYSPENKQSLVVNLYGEANFLSKNVFENESIPVGFENWYSGIATNGQVLRGVIRPIEDEGFLKLWMPISGLSLASGKLRFKEYKNNWQGVVEESANFYQQIVSRRIASVQAEEARKEARARKIQQEQSKFRKMYRQRLGFENSQGI